MRRDDDRLRVSVYLDRGRQRPPGLDPVVRTGIGPGPGPVQRRGAERRVGAGRRPDPRRRDAARDRTRRCAGRVCGVPAGACLPGPTAGWRVHRGRTSFPAGDRARPGLRPTPRGARVLLRRQSDEQPVAGRRGPGQGATPKRRERFELDDQLARGARLAWDDPAPHGVRLGRRGTELQARGVAEPGISRGPRALWRVALPVRPRRGRAGDDSPGRRAGPLQRRLSRHPGLRPVQHASIRRGRGRVQESGRTEPERRDGALVPGPAVRRSAARRAGDCRIPGGPAKGTRSRPRAGGNHGARGGVPGSGAGTGSRGRNWNSPKKGSGRQGRSGALAPRARDTSRWRGVT